MSGNTNSGPVISVIMSVFNGEEYIADAIGSILDQSFTDFEFIIVDDNSNDNTAGIIESFEDPRITLIKNNTNCGLAASLNKAAKISQGEYLARMDADDRSLSLRFERQIEVIRSYPRVKVVGCWIRIIDESGKPVGTKEFKTDRRDHPESFKNKWQGPAHPSVLIDKHAFEQVNGYREQFEYSQDIDLWVRMSMKFGDDFLKIISDILFEYRRSPDSLRKRPIKKHYIDMAGKSDIDSIQEKTDMVKPLHPLQAKYLYYSGMLELNHYCKNIWFYNWIMSILYKFPYMIIGAYRMAMVILSYDSRITK